MENYNQKMRNLLSKYMKNYLDQGFPLFDSACKYGELLYNLECTSNEYLKFYRDYSIYVMYLDAYKLNSYRQKECIAEDEEIDFLGQLSDIEDGDDLLAEVSANPGFLVQLIIGSYRFSEMNGLGKVNVIKSLYPYENDSLIDKFPLHQQDLETYDIKITLKHLLTNIKRQQIHQEKEIFIEFKEAIMISVSGFIRNLVKTDYDNAIELLLEIALADYNGSRILVEKTQDNDSFLDHIDLYENYSKEDILTTLMLDENFLVDAVYTIADVYVYKEFDGVPIEKMEINDSGKESLIKKLF